MLVLGLGVCGVTCLPKLLAPPEAVARLHVAVGTTIKVRRRHEIARPTRSVPIDCSQIETGYLNFDYSFRVRRDRKLLHILERFFDNSRRALEQHHDARSIPASPWTIDKKTHLHTLSHPPNAETLARDATNKGEVSKGLLDLTPVAANLFGPHMDEIEHARLRKGRIYDAGRSQDIFM